MRFSPWFRYSWWVLLVSILAFTLRERWEAIMTGTSQPLDVVLALILFGLLLGPLFPELTLFGVTLKQHTEETKKELQREIRSQFLELRLQLQSVTTASSRVVQEFYMGQPPSDAVLKELRGQIKAHLAELIEKGGIPAPAAGMEHLKPPDGVILAFIGRYQIERELRRIWGSHGFDSGSLGENARWMLRDLFRAKILSPEITESIDDVLRICSPIVHGKEPSPEQVEFIRSVVPDVIAALKAVA